MLKNYKTYYVDVTFCIDVSGEMDYLINIFKEHALDMFNDIIQSAAERDKRVETLRLKTVAFRDYHYDGADAMFVTDFFDQSRTNMFSQCINSLRPEGGGDEPESGLEALAFAIKSDWDTGVKRRNIIVVLTDDAEPHELGFGSDESPVYPEWMPKNFEELTSWWGSRENPGIMNERSKRLILFTPCKSWWEKIAQTWNNTILYDLDGKFWEINYKAIVSAIVNYI